MRYTFDKGQIIPKKLGKQFFDVHSSARHGLKWGANVEVETEGQVCRIRATSEGPVVFIPRSPARKRKNGTLQKHVVLVRNIHIVGAETGIRVTA